MLWFRDALARVINFLPGLIAALVILLVGYIIARALASVTRRLLARVGFDSRLARLGLIGQRDQATLPASSGAASAVFWVVFLVAFIQAARAAGLDMIATALSSVLAYLPHVFAAVLIVAASIVLGNWVKARIDEASVAQGGKRTFTGNLVRAGVLAIGGFMALRELGIAESIVTIAFALTFGAIALATALAFGLGSQRTAEQVTHDWYERRRGNGGAVTRVQAGPGPTTSPPTAR